MKKLFLLSAILIGVTSAAHAGVHLNFGVGLPLPALPLPGVVVSQSYCAPAPVVVAQPEVCAPVYAPAPVVVAPACPPPVRVVVGPSYYPHRYYGHGYYGHGYYGRGHYGRRY